MSATILHERFSLRQQAAALTTALALIITLGIAAALALVLAALWFLAEFALLTVQTIVECMNALGTTYQAADPLIKFCLLVVIGYVLYRAGKYILARR